MSFIKNSFTELLLRDKLHLFKMYNLISFDMLIYLKTIIIKIMHISITHRSFFTMPLCSTSSPSKHFLRQPMICFLSPQTRLQFLAFYRNGILHYVLFFWSGFFYLSSFWNSSTLLLFVSILHSLLLLLSRIPL